MAGTTQTVGSATSSAVNSNWLNVDTTAAERGNGPAQYGYPQQGPPAPVVPIGGSPLQPDNPQLVTDAGGWQYDTEGIGA